MSENKSDIFSMDIVIENIRNITAAVGITSGLCYLLGYLVVNIYFGQYGVQSLGLVQIRYFPAGFLYLVLLALVSLVPFVSLTVINQQVTPPVWQLLILLIANAILIAVIIWICGIVLTGVTTTAIPRTTKQILIWFYLPATQLALWLPAILGGGLFWLTKSWRKETVEGTPIPDPKSNQQNILILATLSGLVLLCLIISVFLFAIGVYPNVSPVFGGGAPIRVRLLVADEQAVVISKTPLEVINNISEAVVLLDQNEKSLLILYGGHNVLELSTSAVTGIIHDNPYFGETR